MYDLVVIGAGWAGFNGCLKARSEGLHVALVEESLIGGTCLNSGCIPTKSLLASSAVLQILSRARSFGIEVPAGARLDLAAVQARKNRIVSQLQNAMRSRLEGVDVFQGAASVVNESQVMAGDIRLDTRAILIATGSTASQLSGFAFDGKRVLSSEQALELTRVPESMLIIGGGVIGCEFATLFSDLGCRVAVVELTPQLLPGIDPEIAKRLETAFKKKRIAVHTGTTAESLNSADFENILVCVGRRPRLPQLADGLCGVQKGRIVTDEFLRTSHPRIFAAGDCTAHVMLAHWAGYQGALAAHNAAHPEAMQKIDPRAVPSCIFTHPEVAAVGLQEFQAQAASKKVTVHRFDLVGSGAARVLEEASGVFKIIADEKDECILGATLIGPKACELIGIVTVAVQARLTVNALRETIFAHPTLSEAVGDALSAA